MESNTCSISYPTKQWAGAAKVFILKPRRSFSLCLWDIVMKSISINELSVEWVAIVKHLIVLDMRCAYIDSMHDESWTNTILTNISFKENEGMANSDALCSFATEQTSNLESSSSRENPWTKEKKNKTE